MDLVTKDLQLHVYLLDFENNFTYKIWVAQTPPGLKDVKIVHWSNTTRTTTCLVYNSSFLDWWGKHSRNRFSSLTLLCSLINRPSLSFVKTTHNSSWSCHIQQFYNRIKPQTNKSAKSLLFYKIHHTHTITKHVLVYNIKGKESVQKRIHVLMKDPSYCAPLFVMRSGTVTKSPSRVSTLGLFRYFSVPP